MISAEIFHFRSPYLDARGRSSDKELEFQVII